MSALNVSNIVNDWIEKILNLPFTIYNDVIPDTSDNAACLRYDPAPAAERRYTDGTRLLKWNLTYYIRNKDRTKAREYADRITARLESRPNSACQQQWSHLYPNDPQRKGYTFHAER